MWHVPREPHAVVPAPAGQHSVTQPYGLPRHPVRGEHEDLADVIGVELHGTVTSEAIGVVVHGRALAVLQCLQVQEAVSFAVQ